MNQSIADIFKSIICVDNMNVGIVGMDDYCLDLFYNKREALSKLPVRLAHNRNYTIIKRLELKVYLCPNHSGECFRSQL